MEISTKGLGPKPKYEFPSEWYSDCVYFCCRVLARPRLSSSSDRNVTGRVQIVVAGVSYPT